MQYGGPGWQLWLYNRVDTHPLPHPPYSPHTMHLMACRPLSHFWHTHTHTRARSRSLTHHTHLVSVPLSFLIYSSSGLTNVPMDLTMSAARTEFETIAFSAVKDLLNKTGAVSACVVPHTH